MTEQSHLQPLPPHVNLPALEAEILHAWRDEKIFERSLEASKGRPTWTFYEGPPTANGKPGTHHVEARVFKDLFPRFKTMKGFDVARKGGWDCHGLPVELAVEKELGFTSKHDIEDYGIAEFNAKCRESVMRHVGEFEALTERMGMWLDTDNAYRTMDPSYIESVWWSLKQIFDKGLLVEDFRIAPYCPRCETGLSDHEVAQGYLDVVDPSVYVRFPITSGPLAELGASLLVWTTTPWTLVSNTAVAVHPQVTYSVLRAVDGTVLVVASELVEKAVGEGAEVLQTLSGSELERTTYARPFDYLEIPDAHYVVLAEYVTTTDGSGLVHQAPAFGADDLVVCRAYGMPVVNPIGHDGKFLDEVPVVGGVFFKDADAGLSADLTARGLMWRSEDYLHPYPHCWRCDTKLLYYATPSWYIRTTAVKDRLLEENAKTDWHPVTIRDGRYGDWLNNNVDWALSRKRYWGTPLPVWRCTSDDEHLTCVGSLAELSTLAGQDYSALDPHRPFVDDVTLGCPTCGAPAQRVPEVIDCWYDAGSMPFAQIGYPHLANDEALRSAYPADFIAEAIDQTRGWFYTMMAIGTLVFNESSYKTVLCLGHILDAEGRKMSKHLGNVIDPHELFDRHGADAVRWLMLATGNPWAARRVGHDAIEEIVRGVLLKWWNTASFYSLYASVAGHVPGVTPAPSVAERPALDRWALSELHATVIEVDAALEGFDTVRAGRRLTQFIDDLSNWYVRRSRRRFWDGDGAALATLGECLEVLGRLMAPFTPFLADALYRKLVLVAGCELPSSVHLRPWPVVDPSDNLLDPVLGEQVSLVRRLVELGRAARAESGVKTRQPLSRALLGAAGVESLSAELVQEICDELNVFSIAPLSSEGDLVDVSVKLNFRSVGKKLGAKVQDAARAVAESDHTALVGELRTTGSAWLTVDGEQIQLASEDLLVTETPRTGWAVASGEGASVALDLEITPELRSAGVARDVVRQIQEARKTSGLDVSDRIEVWWSADAATADALREHATLIGGEVLAVSMTEGHSVADLPVHTDAEIGLRFQLRRAGA